MKSKRGGSLEQGLQRRISHFMCQYRESERFKKSGGFIEDEFLSFLYVKDPSMKRKPEKLVLKLIDNVLDEFANITQVTEELEDDSEFEIDPEIPMMTVKDTNFMNKSLLKFYQPEAEALSTLSETAIEPSSEVADSAKQEDSTSTAVNSDSFSKKRSRTEKDSEKRSRPITKKSCVINSKVKFSDMGGIDECIKEIYELIATPLRCPDIYIHLGIQPPRGILLHGPPGCGKSMLANAIAGECNVPFLNVSAPSIVSGMSGESEKKLREVFEEAKDLAPCILFIDEIDAITPKRETAQREMERRIVAQLLTCMDDISMEKTNNKPVILIGATNRPDSLDPALRRAGRFDREIALGVPDEGARMKILEKLCVKMKLDQDLSLAEIAKLTPGFVGADLNALASEAGMVAVKRISSQIGLSEMEIDESFSVNPLFLNFNQLNSLSICKSDFEAALKKVQPSAKREGFATVPDISWDDIGALENVREHLRMAVVEPVKYPDYFKRVGITAPCGVLLYGPPGCGKTLLAKAVANESHCNFISVKGPELLNKYVGESERAIRQVFTRAAASSPCIIFFDELDAICPSRSNDSESQHASRLVNTLLTEMDGMQNRTNVYVIAATNRPDMIDPAMLRPGRLDKALYVDLPTAQERFEILRTISRKLPLDPKVDLLQLAQHPKCQGFTGADLTSLVREAGLSALKSCLKVSADGIDLTGAKSAGDIYISLDHFLNALGQVSPSVTEKDRKKYDLLKVKFSGSD